VYTDVHDGGESYPFIEKICLKCILMFMMVARLYRSMAESSQCNIIQPLITFRNKQRSWLQLNELVIRENILSISCSKQVLHAYLKLK